MEKENHSKGPSMEPGTERRKYMYQGTSLTDPARLEDQDIRDSLEDLMMAIGRLTTYIFDTRQRLTTVRENLEAVEGHLRRVSERLELKLEEREDVNVLDELP
jgi:hypothetical protein